MTGSSSSTSMTCASASSGGGTTPPIRREVLVAHPAVAGICYDPVRDLRRSHRAGPAAGRPRRLLGHPDRDRCRPDRAGRGTRRGGGTRSQGGDRARPDRGGPCGSPMPSRRPAIRPSGFISIARASMPGQAGGYFGVADEHEDIRVLTVSLDEFAASGSRTAASRTASRSSPATGCSASATRYGGNGSDGGDGSMTDAVVSTGWLAEHLGDRDLFLVDASFKMPGVAPLASRGLCPRAYRRRGLLRHRRCLGPGLLAAPHAAGTVRASLPRLAPSGSATNTGSCSTTPTGSPAPLESGGASALSATHGFRCSMAACGNGSRRAARSPPSCRAVRRPSSRRASIRIWCGAATRSWRTSRRRPSSLLDARAAGRFEGTAPEPWPGRRQGPCPRQPQSRPHAAGGSRDRYAEAAGRSSCASLPPAGIDLSRPVATSCGSGITASVLALGLHEAGQARAAVYDGSWAEWGLPGDLPVDTGPVAPTARTRL